VSWTDGGGTEAEFGLAVRGPGRHRMDALTTFRGGVMDVGARAIGSLLCVVACVVVTGRDAGAQEARGVPELRRELESLEDSARVQLLAPGLVVTDGVFLGFRGDSLRVAEADAYLVVGVEEIEGLSVQRSRWLSVAVQVAGVGLVGGFLAGYMRGSYGCGNSPDWCDARSWRTGVNWGVAAGLSGALVGAAVGSRLLRWRSVFP
jgi:hypothetical protein